MKTTKKPNPAMVRRLYDHIKNDRLLKERYFDHDGDGTIKCACAVGCAVLVLPDGEERDNLVAFLSQSSKNAEAIDELIDLEAEYRFDEGEEKPNNMEPLLREFGVDANNPDFFIQLQRVNDLADYDERTGAVLKFLEKYL